MDKDDIIQAISDSFAQYNDLKLVAEKFGISVRLVKKFVSIAMLPNELKDAINEGWASQTAAQKAVDALGWVRDGDVPIDKVVELTKKFFDYERKQQADRRVHRRIRRQNRGHLCPKCESTKQARKFTVENELEEVISAVESVDDMIKQEKKITKLPVSHEDPKVVWKCIDCGHKWSYMTIL